jgi:hypothetical protein
MNLRRIFIFQVVFSVCISCDPIDDRLTIVNNTNRTVFFEISNKDHFDNYPLRMQKLDTLWDYVNFVKAKQELKQPLIGKRRWERYINQDCQDSTVRIFLFERDLLISASADSLLANQLYSSKFSFKVEDLKKLNWRVEYK